MSNKVGRPLLFKTVEELEKRIEEYFEYCEINEKPMTMSGLGRWRTLLIPVPSPSTLQPHRIRG